MTREQKLLVNTSVVLFIALILIASIWRLSSSEDNSPCNANRFPGKCYEIEREICIKQMASSDGECRQSIKSLNLPPARLTGPIMDRCQQSKYDRVFHYLRKQTAECNEEFAELEAWRKSNPDF